MNSNSLIIQIKHNLFIALLLLLTIACGISDDSEVSMQSEGFLETASPLIAMDTTLDLKFTEAVRSILEDSQGNYWFGSWNEGVCRYDGRGFTYFTVEDGLDNNQVRTIQEDSSGKIWFATGKGGISHFENGKITSVVRSDDPLALKLFQSTWTSHPGDLWFNLEIYRSGKAVPGVARYNGKSLDYLAIPDEVLEREICVANPTITGISKGQGQQVWFASYAGYFGFDGTEFQVFDDDFYYHVRAICEDSKGNLWIGNNGLGVLLYNGEETINFSQKHGVHNPGYLETRQVSDGPEFLARVFSMGEDVLGNMWFGTSDAGLWKWDGSSLVQYTTKDGLTAMEIMEVYTDRQGFTWFGMGDGSVCQFNGTSFDKIF